MLWKNDVDTVNEWRPVTKSPRLTQTNGLGYHFFGKKARQDGRYVTTLYLSIAWMPVLPINRYEVRALANGRYEIFREGPLEQQDWNPLLWWIVAIAVLTLSHFWLRLP